MRTGAEYLEGLDDGRQVWVAGEKIADVRTHPATAGVVAEHARWYDKHHDAAWHEHLYDNGSESEPVTFRMPQTGHDLTRLADASRRIAFESAGNITHPPGYGALIMLGAYDPVVSFGPKDRAEATRAYYKEHLSSGLMMSAPYVPPIGERFLPPAERLKPRVVAEKDGGIIVSGIVGLGTGLPYADVILTAPLPGPMLPEQALWFAFRTAAPGVRIMGRQPSAHVRDPFRSPLSMKYDELDATVILDNVFVPWDSVFVYRDVEFANTYLNHHVTWLVLHHLARMVARAEFSIGLALATADSLGTSRNAGVIETIIDLVLYVSTLRSGLRAATLDAVTTPAGVAMPHPMHIAAATVYALRNRARMADVVRTMAGYGAMLAPIVAELENPEIGPALQKSYGNGPHTARQRAALLHLVRDHTASALDAREAAFEALASAGMHTWRLRTRMGFEDYEYLANAVLTHLDGEDMPKADMSFLAKFDPLTRS
jgi:aromatic ring hydroxylase